MRPSLARSSGFRHLQQWAQPGGRGVRAGRGTQAPSMRRMVARCRRRAEQLASTSATWLTRPPGAVVLQHCPALQHQLRNLLAGIVGAAASSRPSIQRAAHVCARLPDPCGVAAAPALSAPPAGCWLCCIADLWGWRGSGSGSLSWRQAGAQGRRRLQQAILVTAAAVSSNAVGSGRRWADIRRCLCCRSWWRRPHHRRCCCGVIAAVDAQQLGGAGVAHQRDLQGKGGGAALVGGGPASAASSNPAPLNRAGEPNKSGETHPAIRATVCQHSPALQR